jgi:ribosome biogenesis protein Tsr3
MMTNRQLKQRELITQARADVKFKTEILLMNKNLKPEDFVLSDSEAVELAMEMLQDAILDCKWRKVAMVFIQLEDLSVRLAKSKAA